MFELNEYVAEIAGIHAGEGYLRNDGQRAELDISGNNEEKEYYNNNIKRLFKESFNITINNKYWPSRRTYGFVLRNKNIIEFFHETLGFPYGKKSKTVRIPKLIMNNSKKLKCAFLRGLFDTDGSLTFDKRRGKYCLFKKTNNCYPRIIISTISKNLSQEVEKILLELNIKNYTQIYKSKNVNENKKYKIWIHGEKNLKKWINKIGINNPCKLIKYKIWKKYGYCPPKMAFKQLENILKEETNSS